MDKRKRDKDREAPVRGRLGLEERNERDRGGKAASESPLLANHRREREQPHRRRERPNLVVIVARERRLPIETCRGELHHRGEKICRRGGDDRSIAREESSQERRRSIKRYALISFASH